jgi:hypothetical protein
VPSTTGRVQSRFALPAHLDWVPFPTLSDRPRCQLLNLLSTLVKIDPVMLQERGEIADAVRSIVIDLVERKHRLQALLDRLLRVKAQHIVGHV